MLYFFYYGPPLNIHVIRCRAVVPSVGRTPHRGQFYYLGGEGQLGNFNGRHNYCIPLERATTVGNGELAIAQRYRNSAL